jgi:hypothetical protein
MRIVAAGAGCSLFHDMQSVKREERRVENLLALVAAVAEGVGLL